MNEFTTTQYGNFHSKQLLHDELDTETQILELLEDFGHAIRNGNLEEILSFYADDVVAYDMMPPLRFEGTQSYRQGWKKYFTDSFYFPVTFEFVDQKIVAVGDAAYTHGLIHMKGTLKEGEPVENWLRNTTCLEKCDDQWKIVHQHISVPIDSEGRGMMDITPSWQEFTE